MRVTKYPQSCLLLEKNNKRILIDPGNFVAAQYTLDEIGPIDVVLYTHQHGDHADPGIFEQVKARGIPSFGNADVCELLGEGIKQIVSGESFMIAGFTVLPHDIEHFKVSSGTVPQNTGYIIDKMFFHPGDGHENNGVSVDNFAAPIGGPFDFNSVVDFIKSVGAKKVIPIHYTNQQLYPLDAHQFASLAHDVCEIVLLNDGQSTEI